MCFIPQLPFLCDAVLSVSPFHFGGINSYNKSVSCVNAFTFLLLNVETSDMGEGGHFIITTFMIKNLSPETGGST